jgi:hypothetical protein
MREMLVCRSRCVSPLLPAMAAALFSALCPWGAMAANAPATAPATQPAWVGPMRRVHARFTGKSGTFAQFGDSITVTMAYWAPLQLEPKGLGADAARDLRLVRGYMDKACWRDWKGPKFGSEGGMTIRWAAEHIDGWLRDLNPETALIMFGTNDLNGVPLEEYARLTREVVGKCLRNGTVVILSTIPPRSGKLEQARQYNDAVRTIGREMNVPVEDYFAEVLKRRPDDWDGSLPKFKDPADRDEYNVPTLIARDGVHPSAPKQYADDYSDAALSHHGYALRNVVTLRAYAEVIRQVLQPADSKPAKPAGG